MLKLHKLKVAGKKRKRIGRGGATGGTSGRGMGGQKSRSGAGGDLGRLFEGGQMPLVRRLPKRGFNNKVFARAFQIVNIGLLNDRFENGSVITKDLLISKGLISRSKGNIKILGNGQFNKKLVVHGHVFSDNARKLIENSGGEVVIIKES